MKRLLALAALLALPAWGQNYISEEQVANFDVAALLVIRDDSPAGQPCTEFTPPQFRATRTGGQFTMFGCDGGVWTPLSNTQGSVGGGVTSVFGCLGGACSFITMRAGTDELDGGSGVIELPNGSSLPLAECADPTHAGRAFVDTSRASGNQFYICEADGGGPGVPAWVLQGGTGGSGQGYVITDYGATPDDGNDDGNAIRAAYVDACTNGGTVVIPEGRFILGAAPAQNYGVQLGASCAGVRTVGLGRGSSTIMGGPGLTSNNRTLFEVVGASNVSFEAFTCDGNNTDDGPDNWGNCIRGDNMDYSTIARMEFKNFSNHCASGRPDGFNGSGSDFNTWYASTCDGGDQTGFIMFSNPATYGTARNVGNKWIGLTSTGAATFHGYEVRYSDDHQIVACTAEGNAGSGFTIEEGVRRLTMSASHGIRNTQNGLLIIGTSANRIADVKITGSHFDENTLNGARCIYADAVTFGDTSLSSNGTDGYQDDDACTGQDCCQRTIFNDATFEFNGRNGARLKGNDHIFDAGLVLSNGAGSPDAAGILPLDTVERLSVNGTVLDGNLGDGSGNTADISIVTGALDKRFRIDTLEPGFSLVGSERSRQYGEFVPALEVSKARGAGQAKTLVDDPDAISLGRVLQASTGAGETEDLFYVLLNGLAERQATGPVRVRVRVKNPAGVGNDATVRFRKGGPFDAGTDTTIQGSADPVYTWVTLEVAYDGGDGINQTALAQCNAGTCSGGVHTGTGGFDRATGGNTGTCTTNQQCRDFVVAMRAEANSTVNFDGYLVEAVEGGAAGGTECVTQPCDLNSGTQIASTNICREDGTNCPPGSGGETNTGQNVGGGLDNFHQKAGTTLEFNTFDAADFDLLANVLTIDPLKWATEASVGSQITAHGGIADAHHPQTVDTGPVPDCPIAGHVQTGDGTCVDPQIHSPTVDTNCATGGGADPCDMPVATTVNSEGICTDGGSGCGEANTSSNVGGGLTIANSKSGVDLPFRTFNTNNFSQAADLVSLNLAGTYGSFTGIWSFQNDVFQISDGADDATFRVGGGDLFWTFQKQAGLTGAGFVAASNTDPAGFTNANAACWVSGALTDCGIPPGGGGSSKWGSEPGTPNTLYPLTLEDIANDATASTWRITQTGDFEPTTLKVRRKTSGQALFTLKETTTECSDFGGGICEDFGIQMPAGGFSSDRVCTLQDSSSPIPFGCVGDGQAHATECSLTDCPLNPSTTLGGAAIATQAGSQSYTDGSVAAHAGLPDVHHVKTVDTGPGPDCATAGHVQLGDGSCVDPQIHAPVTDTGPVPDCPTPGHVQLGDGSCVDPQIHAPTVDTGPVPDCATAGHVQLGDGSCVDPQIHAPVTDTRCDGTGGAGACNLTTGTQVNSADICTWDGTTATNCPPSSGASVEAFWRFQASTAQGDPGSRNFRVNQSFGTAPGDYQAVTAIYVSDTDNAQLDRTAILASIEAGDELFIQGAGGSDEAYLFRVTGTSDNLTWFQIDVDWVNTYGLIPAAFQTNQAAQWIVLYAGVGSNAYQVVQNQSVDIEPRYRLNFTGGGVSAADDAGNDRTNVLIPGVTGQAYLAQTGQTLDVKTTLAQDTEDVTIRDPDDTDSHGFQFSQANAVTMQEVRCSTDTGTADIQFQRRDETTPNATGTAMHVPLTCDADSANTVTFIVDALSSSQVASLGVSNVTGSPTFLRVHVTYQKDDVP